MTKAGFYECVGFSSNQHLNVTVSTHDVPVPLLALEVDAFTEAFRLA